MVAAKHLEPQIVLQLCRKAVQGSVSYAAAGGATLTQSQDHYPKALQELVDLPAAARFSDSDARGLIQTAADGNSLDAFCLLTQHLKRDDTEGMSVQDFNPLLHDGILSRHADGVSKLLQHPLVQQLSTDDLEEAITEAMNQVACTMGTSNSVAGQMAAAQKAADTISRLLLHLPQVQRLSVGQITTLLQCSLQQQVGVAFKALLSTFPVVSLTPATMEGLLLQAIQISTAGNALELAVDAADTPPAAAATFPWVDILLSKSAAQRLDAAAVGRLINAAAASNVGWFGPDTNNLMQCLLKLPAVRNLDASALE